MIRDLYRSYFQKSHTFLYPLLGLPKNYGPVNRLPKKTFIAAPNFLKPEDMKILVVYDRSTDTFWTNYVQKIMMKDKNLEAVFEIEDSNEIVFIFNLSKFESDYNCFLEGKYSKFSNDARKKISTYFGVHTSEWAYLESFLYPEKYFKAYANILEIDEETLREVGELCDKYDLEKETFKYNIPEQILNLYDSKNNVSL